MYKDVPEEVIFRAPTDVAFEGVVYDGVTRKPLPGAFVVAGAVQTDKLASLTDEQWDALEQLPANPSLDAEALKPIRTASDEGWIVRTDAQGDYSLKKPRSSKLYNDLVFFARHKLPIQIQARNPINDAATRQPMMDAMLFDAAYLMIEENTPGDRGLSTVPEWHIAPGDQPAWYKLFREVKRSETHQRREFARRGWLEKRSRQRVWIPAGLKVQARFHAPYDDKWLLEYDQSILQLKPGETRDLGKLTATPATQFKILLTDDAGEPIEGVPVSYRRPDGSISGPSKNTIADGTVTFHDRPGDTLVVIIRVPAERLGEVIRREVVVPYSDAADPLQVQLNGRESRRMRRQLGEAGS